MMRCVARRSWAERRAGVALVFAITAIPLAGMIGLAVDFSFFVQAKAQLNLAADTAALTAAKTAANAFTAQKANYIALGNDAGNQWFKAQAGTVTDTSVGAYTVAVTQSGTLFTANVTYNGNVGSFFGPLFGVANMAIGGSAVANISTSVYVNVQFLLDNSSSMLIASTPAGVDWMAKNTPALKNDSNYVYSTNFASLKGYACGFACHWTSTLHPTTGQPADLYGFARANNIQLRFDVLKSATQSAITTLQTQATTIANNSGNTVTAPYSVGIMTFIDSNSTTPTTTTAGPFQVYPAVSSAKTYTVDSNLGNAATAAAAINVPVTDDHADTDFPTNMSTLSANSTAAGDGSTAAKAKKSLIIITDGLADYGARSIPSSEGPLNPANCAAMKSLGYSVFVLYTTYATVLTSTYPSGGNTYINDPLTLSNESLRNYVEGSPSTMVTALQSCASQPSYYAEASDPTAVTAALNQLVQAAVGNASRLTN